MDFTLDKYRCASVTTD